MHCGPISRLDYEAALVYASALAPCALRKRLERATEGLALGELTLRQRTFAHGE